MIVSVKLDLHPLGGNVSQPDPNPASVSQAPEPADEAAVTVVLINEMAGLFKKDRQKGSRKTIAAIEEYVKEFKQVAVIVVDSTELAIRVLSDLASHKKIVRIILVGGDGTFFHTLQWVMALSEKTKKPLLYCAGGGEFNYIRRFQKMPYKKPLNNIRFLLGRSGKEDSISWQPVMMEDEKSGKRWYAALIADGLIVNFMDWYESIGKGGPVKVICMLAAGIIGAILASSAGFMEWYDEHGKRGMVKVVGMLILGTLVKLLSPFARFSKGMSLSPSSGEFKVDERNIPSPAHYGIVLSTVSSFSLGIHPFSGVREDDQINCVAYWGTLPRLAQSVLFLLVGRIPGLVSGVTHNTPIKRLELITKNRMYVMDGELMEIPLEKEDADNPTPRTFIFTAGPAIKIGYIRE